MATGRFGWTRSPAARAPALVLCWLMGTVAPASASASAAGAPMAHGQAHAKGGRHAGKKGDKKATHAPADANVDSLPTFSGQTELTWLGHAAWQLRSPGGALLMVDPWLDNPEAPARVELPEALDGILLTHGHLDHVGNAVALARKTGAKVFASEELLALLNLPEAQGQAVAPGGEVVVRDVNVHFTEAVHGSSLRRGDSVAYAGPAMGMVLAIAHGPHIYLAGDTDVFASMSLIAARLHPDIALLPIGGRTTMGPAGAAQAARLLGVKKVLPMHAGTAGPAEQAHRALAALLPAGVHLVRPTAGVALSF